MRFILINTLVSDVPSVIDDALWFLFGEACQRILYCPFHFVIIKRAKVSEQGIVEDIQSEFEDEVPLPSHVYSDSGAGFREQFEDILADFNLK